MRKFLVIAIPTATLIVFVLVMHSARFLKKPLGQDDDIPGRLDSMIEFVNNELWDEANNDFKELSRAWDKVLARVQFGSGKEEIYQLDTSIARLEGAVVAKDKAGALMELYEVYNHWEELGN
ncbi:MAG: DUF4363 family protein [Clostridiales bacterium]|nr:DUF4363 family protein [Clostridiales bacterium]